MTWTSKERRIFTLLIAALLFIIIMLGLSSCGMKKASFNWRLKPVTLIAGRFWIVKVQQVDEARC